MTDASQDQPLTSYDQLLSVFVDAEKPKTQFAIGAEMEKFGVFADGEPLAYDGERGVLALMHELAKTNGWKTEAEYEGGPILALHRDRANITLEPGSQFELSGAPLPTVHRICDELHEHVRELIPFSERFGVKWLGLGFHPFSRRDQYTMVPKSRYPIMKEYLPTRGGLALDMMLRTATVQANYDFSSEEDAMTKMRVGMKLGAVTTAMLANSPFYEGAPFGGKSYRAKVWLDVDPDRSGLIPSIWKRGAKYVDYVEWALDVPMFMFKRGAQKFANTGQTFRSFWKSGFQGQKATLADWYGQLQTVFPEVRLKRTIEVRGADSQNIDYACALPALFTGLYYDDKALSEVDELTADWTHDEVTQSRKEVWQKGLGAKFRAGTLAPIAEKVLDIAERGLERRAALSRSGKDERIHLARLKQLTTRGQSPADLLLDGIEQAKDFRAEVIARTTIRDHHRPSMLPPMGMPTIPPGRA